ncbi:acyltransferase family protein [Falsiroseomonas sp. HW251]|uniref:acyltransferase family protein n=1 Tax=Falsiroseomonas sp. HW251 TaxID=3390998 RepID=UPI003D316759
MDSGPAPSDRRAGAEAATLAARFDPRVNNFDAIRLAAAFVVTFSHTWSLAGRPTDPLSAFLGYSSAALVAVWVFLFISGFLVAASQEQGSTGRFVAARFLRIYPAFAVVILLQALVLVPLLYEGPLSEYGRRWLGFHLRNLLLWPQDPYVPNVFTGLPHNVVNGSLWTIPLEVSFYLCLVVMASLIRMRRALWLAVFAATVCAELMMKQLGMDNEQGPQVFRGIPVYVFVIYFSYFMAGVCAWKYRDRLRVTAGGAAVALLLLVAARGTPMAMFLLKFCLGYLVLAVAIAGDWGQRLHRAAGDLSYGVYLYSFPITNTLLLVADGRFGPFAIFLLSLPPILLMAWLSWHLVEAPCQALKRRLPGGAGAR